MDSKKYLEQRRLGLLRELSEQGQILIKGVVSFTKQGEVHKWGFVTITEIQDTKSKDLTFVPYTHNGISVFFLETSKANWMNGRFSYRGADSHMPQAGVTLIFKICLTHRDSYQATPWAIFD